jgi:hypothetical protein
VAAIAFADNTIGKVINVGNDFEISIIGLAQKVIRETNSKSEIVFVPYKEAYGEGFEDMERRVPNIELINQLVGWKPRRDLSRMIADISLEMSDAVNREFSEIQQGVRLAFMMASHPRLGGASPLGLVSIDVLALIARHIRLV